MTGATAADGRKIALVVGVSAYEKVKPLKNAKQDAAVFADRLRDSGFDVTEVFDADLFTMRRSADRFVSSARSADLALFYYAGHGVQLFDRNYLLARDTDPNALSKADDLGLSLSDFADRLRSSGAIRVALLVDACRDNPLPLDTTVRLVTGSSGTASTGAQVREAEKATSRGLAPLGTKGGDGRAEMLTFFAAQPREVSYDGTGANSFLMEGLLEATSTPDRELAVVLRQASAYVRTVTQGRQVPQVVSDWTVDVSLGGNMRARVEYDLTSVNRRPLSEEERALVIKGTADFDKLKGDFVAKASWVQGGLLSGLSDAERPRFRALGGNALSMTLRYDLDRDGRDEVIQVFNERNVVQVVVEKDGVRATISNCGLPAPIDEIQLGLRDVNGDRRPELFLTYTGETTKGFGRFCILEFTGFSDMAAKRRGNVGRIDAGTSLFRTMLDTEAGWYMSMATDGSLRICSGTSCVNERDFTFDGRRFVEKVEPYQPPTNVRAAAAVPNARPADVSRSTNSASLDDPAGKIAEFIESTLFRSGPRSRDELRSLYGDRVEYFGKRDVSVAEVLKDKERYFGQWTERDFHLDRRTMTVARDGVDLVARFEYTYVVAGSRGRRSGRGTATYRLRPRPGTGYVILAEGGRTL